MATIKTLQSSGLSYFWSKIKAKLQALAGTTETYSVASSAWSALSGMSPFTYEATVTASYTITTSTIVELFNNSAVNFANYGFSVASVSGQSVTIYALAKPTSTMQFKINYKENS